jgi:hypothetical protein
MSVLPAHLVRARGVELKYVLVLSVGSWSN